MLSALPMILVIASGLLLQVKKQVAWVQPPTKLGVTKDVAPGQSWFDILNAVRSLPESGVNDWSDIDRLDVRPSRGIVKVQCRNGWEVQLDLLAGSVLSSTYRRSDFIESLHDGSFFSGPAKLWIFLPNGLALLVLWLTGVWLWYLPIRSKLKRASKARP
jgi:uncharacterized iron-regulated membrane protein